MLLLLLLFLRATEMLTRHVGQTALHKAALNGHLPIITYLLPEKSDVHAKDADGWTALHNACSKVCDRGFYWSYRVLISGKGLSGYRPLVVRDGWCHIRD